MEVDFSSTIYQLAREIVAHRKQIAVKQQLILELRNYEKRAKGNKQRLQNGPLSQSVSGGLNLLERLVSKLVEKIMR